MLVQKLQLKPIINFILVVNMIEQNQMLQKLAVIMKNAVRKVVQAWIAVKKKNVAKRRAQWNAAKTENAQKKGIMVKIAAKKKILPKKANNDSVMF